MVFFSFFFFLISQDNCTHLKTNSDKNSKYRRAFKIIPLTTQVSPYNDNVIDRCIKMYIVLCIGLGAKVRPVLVLDGLCKTEVLSTSCVHSFDVVRQKEFQ